MRMLQWPAEVDAFTKFIVGQDVRHVLEIGTGPGGFIAHLGSVTDGVLISVDLPMANDATATTREGCIDRNRDLKRLHPRYQGVLGSSHDPDTRQRVSTLLKGQLVDLLFLDGDDSFEGKQQDYDLYKQFVREGGLVATHDIASYGLCGVPHWWTVLKIEESETWEFVEPGHSWGGIGVVRCTR